MKNLRNFCIRVNTDYERQVALKFYQRATHLPIHDSSSSYGVYVGLVNNYDSQLAIAACKKVICGHVACANETILSFSNISELADTPNRVLALQKARTSYVTTNPDKEI